MNRPPQAHLERDGEQLPVKLLMKSRGGASGIGEPGAFAVKLKLTWSYWSDKQGKYRVNKESRFKTKLDTIFYLVSNANSFLNFEDLNSISLEL